MFKKKIQFLFKYFIQKIFILLYGKINANNNNFNKLFIKKKIFNFSHDLFPEKSYFIYLLTDCRIYTDTNENLAIIKNNTIIPEISFQQVKGEFKSIEFNSCIQKGTPRIKKKIKGTVFNLAQGASGDNFFHFLFDIIPKVWLINESVSNEEINYFYVNKIYTWQKNIFKIIGIEEKKLLDASIYRHIQVDKLIAVTHPWYEKGFIQNEVKSLPNWIIERNRKKFLPLIKNNKKNKTKLFLDRSGSIFSHCKILNNKELIQYLKKKGFEIYEPEQHTFLKQIEKFNDSDIILGAHGAAFTNIIFCKEKTNIIEIIPVSHPSKKCERISKILNLKYYRYETQDTSKDKINPYNINVDLNYLESLINKL